MSRRGWALLAYDMEHGGAPVVACSNCFLQRYTLVSRDPAKLPDECPKCGTTKDRSGLGPK